MINSFYNKPKNDIDIFRNELFFYVKNQTNKLEQSFNDTEFIKYSEKAKLIKMYMDDTYLSSTQENGIISILEIILGEPVPKNNHDKRFTFNNSFLSAIVPTSNQNSHNYAIGEVTIIVDSKERYGIRLNGLIGNHLPDARLSIWGRIATIAEIREFIDNFKDDRLLHCFGNELEIIKEHYITLEKYKPWEIIK
jgi:hypothetical protein